MKHHLIVHITERVNLDDFAVLKRQPTFLTECTAGVRGAQDVKSTVTAQDETKK